MLQRRFILLFLLAGFAGSAFSQINHWETAVNFNATWRYFNGTAEPPAAWAQRTFNDASWASGMGGIGNGDGDDNTVIPTVSSVYMRRSFTIVDTAVIMQALLSIDYDDGFIAYLNDVEIARANLGANYGDRPPFSQFANAQHEANMYQGGAAESFIVTRAKLRSAMVVGTNVLSVTVHNAAANSPDLSSLTWLHFGIGNATTYFGPNPAWFLPPFTSSNLPLVVIDTHGHTIYDSIKTVADMGIIANPGGARNYLSDPFNDYNGRIAIEIRGSTSQQYPKKSYGFETQDAAGVNNNVEILGMGKENDWILYAPYPDKTLLRNTLAYHMFHQMVHYSPSTRLCEVIIDQQYVGVYEIHERIKVDKSRLDLPKLDADDLAGDSLTGGYVFKVDKITGNSGNGWTSTVDPYVFFLFHDPEEVDLLPAQQLYLQNFMADFEAAHNGPNFMDPDNGYRKYIDVQSFMDFMIMQEIGRTVDGYRSSSFLHKQRDSRGGKLSAGPMWDFNLSFGNADYCDAYLTNGGYQYDFNNVCPGRVPEVPFWWAKFMTDPRWQTEFRCRWDDLRTGPLAIPNLHNFIDSVAVVLNESKDRNFVRWPILGVYVNWNYFVGNTYAEEISYLKTWIADRITWLDANLPGTPVSCASQGAADIQITEVNYNSAATHASNDWFELHNVGATTVDLSGWRMKDGNPDNLFTFPQGTSIPAGGYLVVCTDTVDFKAQYPSVSPILGQVHFDLGNGGDAIRIFDSYYTEQITLRFDDTIPWPVTPDGGGYTLERIGFSGSLSDPTNWTAGCLYGSPGGPYVTPCAVATDVPVSSMGIVAYPNPFNQQLTVDFGRVLDAAAQLSLYDMTGRVLLRAEVDMAARHVLATSDLPAGTYLLRVRSGDWEDALRVVLMR